MVNCLDVRVLCQIKTVNYVTKNNCCGDGVSWAFLAVMRFSLTFLAVLRCSGVPHAPLPKIRHERLRAAQASMG